MNGGNSNQVKTIVAHLCAVGVAAFFLYAAYLKIVDPRQFAIDIKNYKMMPEISLNLMALFMPWWEVGGAITLLIPKTRRAGAIIIAGLLLIFIIAIAYAAFYLGLNINCGCLGQDSSKIGGLKILENIGLLLLTAVSVYLPRWKTRSVAEPFAARLTAERAS